MPRLIRTSGIATGPWRKRLASKDIARGPRPCDDRSARSPRQIDSIAVLAASARSLVGTGEDASRPARFGRHSRDSTEECRTMTAHSTPSDGQTRLAYILGVPLAPHCQRQWPQMGEVVSGSDLIAQVEGNFPELTLEVGRRLHLEDAIVVEWTCNYGDGRLYRNVSIAELRNGEAITVTDYWGEPTATPEWRRPLTGRLGMPPDGIWKDAQHLSHY